MDLNEIVVFAKVVETGSFTAAGQALALPKSTVSRKIAQLEERLDARLLQRTTRKLNLTEIGRAYYERCQKIVSEIAAAEALVGDLQSAPRGLLRVTAPVDLGGQYLGALAADFLRDRPEIQIEAVIVDRILDLVDERVDLAIRFGPLPDSSLVARRLGLISMVACAAPAYLARRGVPVHPDDLADHDVVMFVPNNRLRQWRLTGPKQAEVELLPTPRFAANVLSVVRYAALAGAGVTMLPSFAVHGDLADGRLVRVMESWRGFDGEVFAVYPSTRNLSPKLRVFLDFLADRLSLPVVA